MIHGHGGYYGSTAVIYAIKNTKAPGTLAVAGRCVDSFMFYTLIQGGARRGGGALTERACWSQSSQHCRDCVATLGDVVIINEKVALTKGCLT